MAEGTDAWAALAVLVLKKENPAPKLHHILPCEGQAAGGRLQRGTVFFDFGAGR